MQRRSYAIWTREHGDAELEQACVAAGFRELERLPEMSLPVPPPYLPPPDGVEVRPAADVQTREDYLALVANAWGMTDLPRDVAVAALLRARQPDGTERRGVCRLLRRRLRSPRR